MISTIAKSAFSIAALAGVFACGLTASAGGMSHKKDIVETAVDAGQFKTLTAALEAAGLVDTLKGPGPFTVFAPTDEAFARLPKGEAESLLKPENKAKLTAILTYHVAPGELMAADVAKKKMIKTVNGAELTVSTKSGAVMINDAHVVSADIKASNGVIHVIDAVLMPPSD